MSDYTAGFERFWNAYPKHKRKGKGAAFASWKKHHLEDRATDIATVVERQGQWDDHFKKYTPLPATYLNQGRYDDDVPKPPRAEAKIVDDSPQYECSKWESLGNRLALKWLRFAGPLDDATLRQFRSTLKSTVAELSGPCEEEVAAGDTQEAVWTFATTLLGRLDHDLDRELRGRVLNMRERA